MDSTKKEYPVVYVYMLESIDGKASGEVLNAPASLFGKIIISVINILMEVNPFY